MTAATNIYRSTLIKTTTHVMTNHSPLNKNANAKTSILTEQYNTWNKSTISRKLLKMDVLTFEACWAVNSEIIKQVTSSYFISSLSPFTDISIGTYKTLPENLPVLQFSNQTLKLFSDSGLYTRPHSAYLSLTDWRFLQFQLKCDVIRY